VGLVGQAKSQHRDYWCLGASCVSGSKAKCRSLPQAICCVCVSVSVSVSVCVCVCERVCECKCV